ncbi:Max dimerization protein 4 (predicted), isoform CRA_a [Rattus norvegicus]|uniref:Max dimerization protein 4 (Predicted), isoform CRA_a n=1 Tax=Rattus norvegicus TaxID=10116 RepID=A6IK40_RAT|nr:Max dimerization protein 4 (predicted), isoform CRA_a [Rattus norvegicus]|eukprot:NP_001101834.1 max dimerization protein 4 [Rattus norvegicus]
MCQFEGLRRRVAAQRWSPRVALVCRQARGVRRAEPAGARRAAAAAVPCAGGRMELNSLLLLLEAAEYLERRDREAEHGYASVLPFDDELNSGSTWSSSSSWYPWALTARATPL